MGMQISENTILSSWTALYTISHIAMCCYAEVMMADGVAGARPEACA